MVQVDVVWAYSFGATFAACAARQLKKEATPFNNRWYTFTLLFLAIFFAPSGLYLLWQFPSWETMQVARGFANLPAWLVCGFAVTNITQGILGYWVTYTLIRKGNYYAAHANWMWSWVLFWFILVCGWDCTGYQRFMYDSTVFGGQPWAPGKLMGLDFFWHSNVWWTLVVMGICFLPMLIYGFMTPIRQGAEADPEIASDEVPGIIQIVGVCVGAQWAICLGLAILAALMVMGIRDMTGSLPLGYFVGVPLFIALAQMLLFRRGMPMHSLVRLLYVREPGERATEDAVDARVAEGAA